MYKTLFIAISPKGKSKSLVPLENGGTAMISCPQHWARIPPPQQPHFVCAMNC